MMSVQTLEQLNLTSRGDMRGAINILQSAELLLDEGAEVSPHLIEEIAGVRELTMRSML
jgi:DNA polymerase III delta prime subunit